MANWWENADRRGYGNTGITGVYPPTNMAAMVGRTNWTPQNITEETETIYPESNDLDATYTAEDAFYTPQQNKWYNRITTPVMGIMRAIGDKFQRPEAKQRAYESIMDTGTYKGNPYALYDTSSGLKIGSDILGYGQGYAKNFDSMFGSKSIEEMEDKKIEWAMNRINKGKAISQRLRDALTDRGYLGGDKRGDQRTYTYGGTKDYGPYRRTNVPTHIGPSLHGSDRSDRTYTGHGRSGMGRDPSDRMASGGRVGLYQGGDPTEWMGEQETITPFQLQHEEGVPLGLMASAPDPMDALNDMSMNIFGKPLHQLTPEEYQMLIDMANDQAMADQPEGLASLV